MSLTLESLKINLVAITELFQNMTVPKDAK